MSRCTRKSETVSAMVSHSFSGGIARPKADSAAPPELMQTASHQRPRGIRKWGARARPGAGETMTRSDLGQPLYGFPLTGSLANSRRRFDGTFDITVPV